MAGAKAQFKDAYKKVRGTFSYLSAKKYTTLAGTMAFFLIMSVVPFLFWLTLLFGRLKIVFSDLLSLEIFMDVKEIFDYLQESARAATASASVILLATTLYSSTTLFYHMRRSGEIIYESRRKKGGLVLRFSALVLMFIVMLMLVAGMILFLIGHRFLNEVFPSFVAQISVYVLFGVFMFALILLLNMYVSPYRIGVRGALWGSLLTLLLGGVASFGFSIYTKFSSMEKLYGAAVFLILFLLWLYVLMICFVIGIVFNCYLFEQDGRKRAIHKKF